MWLLLIKSLSFEVSPLFSVTRWPSYMAVDQAVLRRSIQEVIRNLFQGIEKSHGHVLVSKALGYLTLSKGDKLMIYLNIAVSCWQTA